MDSKRSYRHLMPSLMVAATLILSACQESKHLAVLREAPLGETTKPASLEKAKVSEEVASLAKNPTSLEFYPSSLLGQQISNISKEAGSKNYEFLFNSKTWYFGPAEKLKDIEAKVTDDGEAGIVRQSQFEILVDTDKFHKLSLEEQEDIVLTEMLKGLYSLKNLNDEDFCDLMRISHEDASYKCNTSREQQSTDDKKALEDLSADQEDVASQAKTAAAPKKGPVVKRKSQVKALTEEDMGKIHNVKDLIVQRGLRLSISELHFSLKDNGFDTRILNELPTVQKFPHRVMPAKDVSAYLKKSVLLPLNGKEFTCFGLRLNKSEPCKITVQEVSSADFENKETYLRLTVTGTGEDKKVFFDVNVNTPPSVVSFDRYSEGEGKGFFRKFQLKGSAVQTSKENPNFGAAYTTVSLIVGEAHSEQGTYYPKMLGLLAVPATFESTSKDSATEEVTCVGKIAEAKDMSSDAIFIGSKARAAAVVENSSLIDKTTPPCVVSP